MTAVVNFGKEFFTETPVRFCLGMDTFVFENQGKPSYTKQT